ncbi:saccharopine dehydrogenase family protein [Corallococcus sp. RDP092CA]|uniref:saccharopine dehydrogenase family protein n=1 Tax=Corallococcus sp. RDP092CA TaxID=3109369 RepID=UPI0035B25468
MTARKRVLLVGGTGATGRRIAADLRSACPEVALCVAGRRPPLPGLLPEGVTFVALDVEDPGAAARTFREHDLVVLALGPFELHGGTIHRLCIEAGTDCVDINDSFEAAERILALDALAKERGVLVATGMGLVPGLSTLLVMSALEETPPGAREVSVRLFMGAKNGGGSTSPYTLLAGFRPRTAELREGRMEQVPTQWGGPELHYDFPGFGAAPTFHFSCPESLTLARAPRPRAAGLRRVSHRYHVQFFPFLMARAFAALPLLRTRPVLQRYSRMLAGMHGVTRDRKGSLGLTSLVVDCKGEGARRRRFVSGEALSAYHLTASFAAMVVEMLLDRTLPRPTGVASFEDLYAPELPFSEYLQRRNITLQSEP